MLRKIVPILLLLTPWAWGQTLTMHGTYNSDGDTVTIGSNISNCTGPSSNCFHSIPNSLLGLPLVSSSPTGALVLFMDGNGYIDRYYSSTNTFSLQGQYGNNHSVISVGGIHNVFGLNSARGSCPTGSLPLEDWVYPNGPWVSYSICAQYIAATSMGGGSDSGTVFIVYTDSQVYEDYNGGWAALPTLPGSGAVTGLAASPANDRAAVVRGGQVYTISSPDGGATWGNWIAVGSNNGALGVYFVNDPVNGLGYFESKAARVCHSTCTNGYALYAMSGSSWLPITGFFSTVYPYLGIGGGVIYAPSAAGFPALRYSIPAPLVTHKWHIVTSCNPAPCPATTHTYHSTLTIGGVNMGEQYKTGPANQVTHVAFSTSYDPFAEFQNGDGWDDGADCPIAGPNFVSSKPHVVFAAWGATTFFLAGSGPTLIGNFGDWGNTYKYTMLDSCVNGGGQEDFQLNAIHSILDSRLGADVAAWPDSETNEKGGITDWGNGYNQKDGMILADTCTATFNIDTGTIASTPFCNSPWVSPSPPFFSQDDSGEFEQEFAYGSDFTDHLNYCTITTILPGGYAKLMQPDKNVLAQESKPHVHHMQ